MVFLQRPGGQSQFSPTLQGPRPRLPLLRGVHDEVAAVEGALQTSLAQGRSRLAMLVSRRVDLLDAAGVRESAIESLAENFNDSFVAPLFWFVVAGLPGAALYRYANTADAMWGYRGERKGRDWTWTGKWAARADDVLSWIPARISAAILTLAAWRWPRNLGAEAGRTPSPNSGWPMAAMALALDLRLGKAGVYVLHSAGQSPQAVSVARALRLATRAAWLAGVACALCLFWTAGAWIEVRS